VNISPISIIDDDSDDRQLLKDAWQDLGYPNQLLFFDKGKDLLHYLTTEKTIPFLIL
jgi:hypothetical protein